MTKLNALLRQARAERQLTLRDVELLSGNTITNVAVSNIEIGKVTPLPCTLKILSRIYKLDFLELMVMAGHVERSDLKRVSVRGGQ